MKIRTIGIVVALLGVMVTSVIAASNTTVVTENDLEDNRTTAWVDGSWFMYNDETDQIDNSLGTFVFGPGSAPSGQGSVEFSVSGSERPNIATYRFSGIPLESITTLAFSTYNPSAGNGGGTDRSGYLHFNVDFDGSDTWQSRLVFVPRDNGIVQQDTWQEWDAIDSGNAKWRYSGATWPGTSDTGMSLKTWDEILTVYDDVRIRVTDSFLGVRVGEPYPSGYTENIDAIKFGVDGDVELFDFEPLVGPPDDKSECKNGGWQEFNNPAFKNQGDCVSFVVSNSGN